MPSKSICFSECVPPQQRSSDQSGLAIDAGAIGAAFRQSIRQRVSGPAFGSYFITTVCLSVTETEIVFGVRDNFCRQGILSNYLNDVHACLRSIGLTNHHVRWAVTGDSAPFGTPMVDVALDQSKGPRDSGILAEAEPLNLAPQHGDTTLIAIPMVRHFLFAPDKTKLRVRNYSIEVKHKGRRFVQEFRIGDVHAASGKGYGVLTVKHQKALFVLQDLWQQQGGKMVEWQGNRLGLVTTSSSQLEKRMFGSRGGRQKEMLRQMLQELVSIPVAVKNYVDADGELVDVDVTGLLAGALFNQTGKRGAWVQIVLGTLVTRAFERSNLKPLALQVLEHLPDVPALLYPKIDHMLSNNTKVAWRLTTLVQNLGLTGEVVRQPSRRRRLFRAAADKLDGVLLSRSNQVLRAHVSEGEAADGEDLFVAISQNQALGSCRHEDVGSALNSR